MVVFGKEELVHVCAYIIIMCIKLISLLFVYIYCTFFQKLMLSMSFTFMSLGEFEAPHLVNIYRNLGN